MVMPAAVTLTSAPMPSRFDCLPIRWIFNQWIARLSLRSLSSTRGGALNSLVMMSRSPSLSTSKMTAERVPMVPVTVTWPVLPLHSRCPLSAPEQSSVNQGCRVRPPGRGSMPTTKEASRNTLPRSLSSSELTP